MSTRASEIGPFGCRADDAGELVRQIGDGAESLFAMVSSWPLCVVREPALYTAERSLHALMVLVARLRTETQRRQPNAPTEALARSGSAHG